MSDEKIHLLTPYLYGYAYFPRGKSARFPEKPLLFDYPYDTSWHSHHPCREWERQGTDKVRYGTESTQTNHHLLSSEHKGFAVFKCGSRNHQSHFMPGEIKNIRSNEPVVKRARP